MQPLSFTITPSQAIFKTVQMRLADFFAVNAALLDGLEQPELLLCLVEAIQNGRIHGGGPQEVRCELSVGPHEFVARVWDHNPPFSLKDKLCLPEDPYAESGRGLAIIQQLVDGLALARYEDGNCLTLTKFLRQAPARSKKEEDGPLDLLYEMSESIVQANEVNFDRIYQLVLDKAIEVFGVDRASIMNFDPEHGLLKIVASRGLPDDVVEKTRVKPGEGVSGRVFQEAKPVIVGGTRVHDSYKSDSFISAPMLCSPMRMGETCVGVINITERRDGRAFEEKDLKLLTTLANQAASYLRIGHLIEQVKESQKFEQELAWARRIQRSLFPQGVLKLPDVEIGGHCEMAKDVGGDYFDYIEEGPYLYLVVADVSGHNLPAALTMINFRSLLRSQIGLGGSPAAILQKVNALIYHDLIANEQQITVALVRIDRKTHDVRYANAGHPPIFYLKPGEKTPERWKADGILLGAVADAVYEELVRPWAPFDVLLLYTDGVIEAGNRQGMAFGESRLASLFAKHSDLPVSTLVLFILKEVHRHTQAEVATDDLTLMHVALR